MRTSLFLFLFGLAAAGAAAQTPVPPAKPVPARKPVQPATPRPPSFFYESPLVDLQWPELPSLAFHDLEHQFKFDFPHELMLPSLPSFDLAWPHELQVPPLAWPEPMLPSFEWQHDAWQPPAPPALSLFGTEPGGHGQLSRIHPEQGSPEDSLFRAAQRALNGGEYARATSMFESFVQKYPRSRSAPSAFYWSAFALYRAGSTRELQSALEKLKAQQERYPDAARDPDAATLRTRLYSALAARGDAQAATALREATAQGPTCDREEMEVRQEALSALAQLNTPEARPTLKRVLARRDECSATLRRRAVYILGRAGTDESVGDLQEVVKNDPDAGVRSDAVMMIGRSSGANTMRVLEQIFNESTDERVRASALSAIRSRGGPEAKRILRAVIERGDLSERARVEAIQQLGRGTTGVVYVAQGGGLTTVTPEPKAVAGTRSAADEEDAAFLRGLYPKTDSRNIKSAIISSVARIGGTTNEQWLLALAKNSQEELSLRREALSRIKTTTLSIDELGKLFDALSERDLRYAVVSQLASRDEPAAVDKLIEIAKSGTDPQVRRQAIAALARKNDPRTTKLLLELVEKP